MTTFDTINMGSLIVATPIATRYGDELGIVYDILGENNNYRTASQAKTLYDALQDDCIMRPIHTSDFPIIIDHQYIALVWENVEEPGNADYMAGIIFMKIERNGKPVFEPAAVVVGDEFEGVFQYRTPCCSSNSNPNDQAFSMTMFVKQDDETFHKSLDTEFTKNGCKQLFEKLPHGVMVSSHDINHMLAHHEFGHDHNCGHDHSNLPKPAMK